jgi:hypothetical protein
MTKLSSFAAAALTLAALSSPALAAPPSPATNWGQQVKQANQGDEYPGGTSRGGYVREQARDDQGPGYGYEIQTLAPIGGKPAPHK